MERWPPGLSSDAGSSRPAIWGRSGTGPRPGAPPLRTKPYLLHESHLGWDWVRPGESNGALPPLSISASVIILKVSAQNPLDLPLHTQLKEESPVGDRLIKSFYSTCLYKVVLSGPKFTHTLPPPKLLLQHPAANAHWHGKSRQRTIQFLPKYREPSTFVSVIHEHI